MEIITFGIAVVVCILLMWFACTPTAEEQREREEEARKAEQVRRRLDAEDQVAKEKEREEYLKKQMLDYLIRKRNESITCPRCDQLAEPIDGTSNRYRCPSCGFQNAGPAHSFM